MACCWHIRVVKVVDILKLMGYIAKNLAKRDQEVRATQKLVSGHESGHSK